MALYLIELTPATASKDEATALIETVSNSLSESAELIETQVSADHKLIFAIIESENTYGAVPDPQEGERAQVCRGARGFLPAHLCARGYR